MPLAAAGFVFFVGGVIMPLPSTGAAAVVDGVTPTNQSSLLFLLFLLLLVVVLFVVMISVVCYWCWFGDVIGVDLVVMLLAVMLLAVMLLVVLLLSLLPLPAAGADVVDGSSGALTSHYLLLSWIAAE